MACHALLIGFDEYRAFSPTPYAFADVQEFGELLGKKLGVSADTITLFGHKKDKAAGVRLGRKDDIITIFHELCKQLKPEDSLVFYYAGHGVEKDNDYYLLTPLSLDDEIMLADNSLPMSRLKLMPAVMIPVVNEMAAARS